MSLGNLFSHARQISRMLPKGHYAINLCRNRYLFTVSYLAVVIRNQINLLPQNQSHGCIENLLNEYTESYCITDQADSQFPGFFIEIQDLENDKIEQFPDIQENSVTSISFTSGSTGQPKAIPKTFQEFYKSAQLATDRLEFLSKDFMIVSTVPPQHMYGLETSVFWPLVAATPIHSSKPFFPEDIRRVIADSKQACALISTPTHLKACVESNLSWTHVDLVLSSTASMPENLAVTIEKKFDAPLMEIFGSTETLSYASRRLTVTEKWRPYNGIRVASDSEGCYLEGGHINSRHKIDDRLEIDSTGCFSLLGRSSDLVKIGGKRASLNNLNQIINTIDGVTEGLFYLTDHGRLGALVVTQRSKQSILAELRLLIDEVFLPRPFHSIQKIPRNEMGKVVKLQLDHMIKGLDIA